MEICAAKTGSEDYVKSVALREEVLRKPLGRTLTREELLADADREHFVAVEQGEVIASVSSYFEAPGLLRLKQMAVAPSQQGKGIGGKLLAFAEDAGKEKGAARAKLHARITALQFYLAQGYEIVSEEMLENGIPHVVMEKPLG